MSFPAVLFGSFTVGTGFTDGSSLTEGGFRVFIVPTQNIGNAPLDVGITYVDQHGNPAETTTVTTSVPANTSSGTHIQVVLNAGDTGIRDITAVSVTGGTAGDHFNLESWNEGFVKTFSIAERGAKESWEIEPTKSITRLDLKETYWQDFFPAINTGVVVNQAGCEGGDDVDFMLATEVLEPDYVNEVKLFGLLEPTTFETQSNGDKQLKVAIGNLAVTRIDGNEESIRFKWKWVTDHYEDVGFFRLEFDLAFNPGSLFYFDVLDKDSIVQYARNSAAGGWSTPSRYSQCGAEGGYPASNANDWNTNTEWRHFVNELHWMIFDLGSSRPVGGLKIYFGGAGSGWDIDVYASDEPANFGPAIKSGWNVSGAAGWKTQEFVPVTKRYIKIEINPANTDNYLDDFRDIQVYLLEHITLNFKSFAWEIRFRANATGTAGGSEYVDIRNIRITRYRDTGTSEYLDREYIPKIDSYDTVAVNSNNPAGAWAKFQLAFSDDGTTWSAFVGPDGTNNTFYYRGDKITVPGGYLGKYFKWLITLVSDGRDTPALYDFTVRTFVKLSPAEQLLRRLITPGMPVSFTPLIPQGIPWIKATDRIKNGWAGGLGNEFIPEMPKLALINKAGGISDVDTAIPYDGDTYLADPFHKTCDFIRVDDEIMQVTDIDTSAKQLTVLRGQNGTIAAGHADNSLIAYYSHLIKRSDLVLAFYRVIPRPTPGWPDAGAGGDFFGDIRPVAKVNKGGGILAADTEIPYNADVSADNFSSGDMIYIDLEIMKIIAVDYANNKLTVQRAQNGTTTATHANNSTIVKARLFFSKELSVFSSWLESVVGQILSGYIRDQNENIIVNGLKVVLISDTEVIKDTMGKVDPVTGFYQIAIKATVYSNRWAVARQDSGRTFDVAYRKYGTPLQINGMAAVSSPQDLHFWKPAQICGKSVAYVGSLVTY